MDGIGYLMYRRATCMSVHKCTQVFDEVQVLHGCTLVMLWHAAAAAEPRLRQLPPQSRSAAAEAPHRLARRGPVLQTDRHSRRELQVWVIEFSLGHHNGGADVEGLQPDSYIACQWKSHRGHVRTSVICVR